MTPTLMTTGALGMRSTDSRADAFIPADVEGAKALIIAEGTRLCAAAFGDQALAVVLTGSMSRGETTLKKEGNVWRVLGDATFLVIFEHLATVHTAELEREIERTLLSLGVNCRIVVVTASASNLRNMKPHIYAYELRERGIVLWGDKEVLDLMPRCAASDIPQEDGWWLLCNRMIEQIESAAIANSLDVECTAVQYRIAKLYLAMGACYLLVIGCYEPTYRDRARRLQQLAASHEIPDAPIDLQRFSTFVSLCTDLKLHGELDDKSQVFPGWRDAVSDAEHLWRFALGRVLGVSPNLSRKKLISIIAARQALLARAKGWARAAYLHPGGLSRYWLHQPLLAISSSPRYLIYGAASELFFMAPEPESITTDQLAEVVARLPISAGAGPLSWQAVAKLVARNFHVFLESSRS